MSAFSFTAPRFTPEMVEAEHERLSEEEKERIRAEIQGLDTDDLEETPELIEKSLAEFEEHLEAIKSKNAYTEALERCPELVKVETPPIRFLRSESFDAEAAAKRLVAYWDLRKQVFGADKAFLPLRLENGALGELEVEMMRNATEGYMLLPKPDKHGRAILYTNKSAFDFHKYNRMVVTRVFWYVLHLALEKEEVQKKGVVVVASMHVTHPGQMDRRQLVLGFKAANHALPVKWKACHICRPPGFFFIIWPILAYVMGESIRQRCIPHNNHNFLDEMESVFGIPRKQIPKSLGGDYHVNGEEWIQTRIRAERNQTDNNRM